MRPFLELLRHQIGIETGVEKPLCCTMSINDLLADIMEKNKGAVNMDAVAIGARHMAAMELASHPHVYERTKKLYKEHATVTTTPTDLGEKVCCPSSKGVCAWDGVGAGSISCLWLCQTTHQQTHQDIQRRHVLENHRRFSQRLYQIQHGNQGI